MFVSILSRLRTLWASQSLDQTGRRRAHFRPRLETLESRWAPAGNLTTAFSAGLLTITADNDLAVLANNPQDITLTGTGPGALQITGNSGETFAGAGTTFTGVTN